MYFFHSHKQVFEFMKKTIENLKDRWAKGIEYEMSVSCKNSDQELHLIPVTECKEEYVSCDECRRDILTKDIYWELNAPKQTGEFTN